MICFEQTQSITSNVILGILEVIRSLDVIKCNLTTPEMKPHFEYYDNGFESQITIPEDQQDNIAVLQTKLIEPFTNLYFTKEKQNTNFT